MNAYHDIRSIRSWLSAMYPNTPILVQRNIQNTPKPYFFLEQIAEDFTDRGYGWFDTNRTVRIHIITQASNLPDNKQDTYGKAQLVTSFLRDRCLFERVIPEYLYAFSYPYPTVFTDSGGTFNSDTYRFAITMTDFDDHESMLSAEVVLSLELPQRKLKLSIPNWPVGRPIAKKFTIYYRATDTSVWQAIKEVDIQRGSWSTETEVTALTALSPIHTPPTQSRVRLGFLKVQDASCSMLESMNLDDAFNAYTHIRLFSRAPRVHTASPRIQMLGETITVR